MTATTQEIINQTLQLVAIPSTLDNPNALRQTVDFVADFVATHADVTIERFEQNGITSFLAYKGATRPNEFDILLNGHVDVVPAAPEQFMPYIEDGKLYGRGVLDMKGTAMVLANVFCELVNQVPYSLGLEIVSDEENNGDNGVQYHIAQGVHADFAIMGEYSNHRDAIYNSARGHYWVEVAFKGRAAHGAYPWRGDNAILKASSFASAILARYPIPDEETWTTTATISSISTPNATYNKVPDYAVVKVDFRFVPEDDVFASEETLRKFITGINSDAEILSIASYGSSVYVDEKNTYVKGLSRAMATTTDIQPRFMARSGSSDARHFAEYGVSCVEFGLYGHNSHSEDEYVEIDSFEEYAATMRAFLKNPRG
jgi:succinyl-diaminopimelate desuccinylase